MSNDPKDRVIGISISNSPDLGRLGYGEEHLRELMIAIARALLRLGTADQPVHLAYGGDLRPGGFTETLLDLARAESQGGWRGRMYSFLAWPYYLGLSRGDEALRLDICRFIRVTPADAGLPQHAVDTAPESLPKETKNLLTARCISRLREMMTEGGGRGFDGEPVPPLAARIILGGKTGDYTGIMPGLFEEFMLAQEVGIPIFVAGGFGGAAGAIADAVLGGAADPADVFSLEHQRAHNAGVAALLDQQYKSDGRGESPQARYERLARAIAACRADLDQADGSAAHNGLDRAENERLMRSQHATEITGLIDRGLRRLWSGEN
jgi:hypothetical protein